MARAVGNRQSFTGQVRLASVDDLDAFVRRAAAEDSFIYCEAPDLIRSPTSARVTELAAEGLVRPHQKRRQDGGWSFYVARTKKARPRPLSAAEAALADPATALIFGELKRAAELGLQCPSDSALARKAGFLTRNQAQWRLRRLVDAGLINSTLAYERGVPTRVVTIVAGSHAGSAAAKHTRMPPGAARHGAAKGGEG